ncbi:MAG: M48 family metalloprotease [Myxococcales bacterium]|nr:M48 family metalloprotease [Myxococcales bacterium]
MLVAGALLTGACMINAATGRLQLTTISESEEIRLGTQNDEEVVAALGLYEDEELQGLVSEVGDKLAASSERPGLPWTFRVLDEPAVNAFALPGGYVYTTRGLLVHLGSEDELAAVLGHEIGHVTARHGVVQLRKTRVAAASVGVFRVIDPNLRHVGGIAAGTAGLALLKHSRDDEYEADSLGLRYAERAGYDRAATIAVFDVLVRVSQAEAGERVPAWMSTHPEPELRRERVRSMLPPGSEPPPPDPEYLARLAGVVYGPDPRQGYVAGQTFVHPPRGFAIDLPTGWEATHEGPRVMAVSEDEQALLVLTPSEAESAAKALEEFFADGSLERGEGWEGTVSGFPVVSASFSASASDGTLMGLLAFVDYEDGVLALAAMGPAEGWEARSEAIAACFASLRRASAAQLRVEPMRVRPWQTEAETTLASALERRPASIELAELARLNGVDAEATLPAGTWLKWVDGFDPRAAAPAAAPTKDDQASPMKG